MGKSSLLLLCWLAFCSQSFAQLTVTTLTELQRGKVPGADASAISTGYTQINADLTERTLQIGLRAEAYDARHSGRNYYDITQKYARWTQGAALIEVGNYYAMLGRGLTLRAFELPGVVLESQLYRLRYAPTQDMEGAYAAWTGNHLTAKALIGRPALGGIPPGAKTGSPPTDIARREDWVSGGELALRPFSGLKFGGTIVHIAPKAPQQSSNWVWSALGEWDFSNLLANAGGYANVYGEYARRQGGPKGHGLYLSGTTGGSRIGLSVEYKDYDNMTLRFNDPPSLVREHTAFLLNRATHVLVALNEKGYQVEGTFTQPGLGTLTANVSQAHNHLSSTFTATFKERHIGLDLDKIAGVSPTLFFNWGKDDLAGTKSRRTAGIDLETETAAAQSFAIDLQYQASSRPFGDPADFKDLYTSFSWQHPKGFGAALVIDHTTDPFDVDRPETNAIETGARTFWSVDLNTRLNTHYDAVLFLGERRGGTACTSGTCYQVLPFKGAEMRINTYF